MFQAFLNHAVTSQKTSGAFGPVLVSWNPPGTSISFFHLVNSDAYIRSPNMSSAHAIRCNYHEVCKSTNRALAVAMVTGLSSGGLQCRAIYHFNKNYMCVSKGRVWAHNHWRSVHLITLYAFERWEVEMYFEPLQKLPLFSAVRAERCRLGLLCDIWCNPFSKDETEDPLE